MDRRTKIVATLGPATDDPVVLDGVLAAGVDVARINFSHGSADEHLGRVARLREAANRLGKVVAVLADLPGPKLRVKLPAPRDLKAGDCVSFCRHANPTRVDDIALTEPELLDEVRPGQRILLDDGRLQLVAGQLSAEALAATVVVGGTLKPNKGLNLPETELSISAVTPRDREALAVAARVGADWLALSFVRGPEAAEVLRGAAMAAGFTNPRLLAKLERPEAVRRAAAITAAFDAVMVARGDLGVEIPLAEVPIAQKRMIAEARYAGKPVVTATDMLDSMRESPRPTRAEASDVANAIFDGTDAVMLSGETAIGKYPVEAVRCMAQIAEVTEGHLRDTGRRGTSHHPGGPNVPVADPMAQAAVDLADEVGAAAVLTPTLTGRYARLIARHRPWARIVGLGPTPEVLRGMAPVWGVRPVLQSPLRPGDDRLAAAVRDAFAAGAVAAGERVVVLAGHPHEAGPGFPTLRVVRVGEGGASGEP
jgi:pyruvate kinase